MHRQGPGLDFSGVRDGDGVRDFLTDPGIGRPDLVERNRRRQPFLGRLPASDHHAHAAGGSRIGRPNDLDGDVVDARCRSDLGQGGAGVAAQITDGDVFLAAIRQKDSGRTTRQNLVAHPVIGQGLAAIRISQDGGREDMLGTGRVDSSLRPDPGGVNPVLGDKNFVAIPIGDGGGVNGHVAVAFHCRADDAPGLAWFNDNIFLGIAGATVQSVFNILGVADGVVVIDLVASAGEETALVHLDDVANAFEDPFDSAVAARLIFLVGDRRNQDVLGPHRIGGLQGPHDQVDGMRIEVAEIAQPRGFGVGADNIFGRHQKGEIARILGNAEAAAQQREADGQQRYHGGNAHDPTHHCSFHQRMPQAGLAIRPTSSKQTSEASETCELSAHQG